MRQILLLNPNTSTATTDTMVALVQAYMPANFCVQGVTALEGAPLITNAAQLGVAQAQVLDCWQRARSQQRWDGVILACFADPALEALRCATGCPTVGIGQAAMLQASHGGIRFGIATTTPDLDAAMQAQVQAMGLAHCYTGAHYTQAVPSQLTAQALQQQLLAAVQQCAGQDGAQCVVIGGGPLGQVAQDLQGHTSVPLVAPLQAAAQWMVQRLCSHDEFC